MKVRLDYAVMKLLKVSKIVIVLDIRFIDDAEKLEKQPDSKSNIVE